VLLFLAVTVLPPFMKSDHLSVTPALADAVHEK
jgi:hypothetical protein